MKVLYLLNNLSIGGAEMGLLHLIRHGFFADAELEIAVLFEGSGKLREKLSAAGFNGKVTVLMPQRDMTVKLLLHSFLRLRKLLDQSHPDTLLLSLPQANILGRIAARAYPRMKVVTFEHTAHFGKPYYGKLLSLTSGRVDAVLYDCEVTASAMQQYYKQELPWHYAPLVSVQPEQHSKEAYLLHEPPSILSVGRLSLPKNYPAALKAIALLKERGQKVHYYIAGEGDLRSELETQCATLGITENVTFLGFVDWRPWQMRADIFLQASAWEGLCISVIEAMGAGMPVVATDVGGIRDYGKDSRNMVKAIGTDAASIAEGLGKMLKSEDNRRELGSNARADIIARFNIDTVTQQLREAAKALVPEQPGGMA